MKANHNYYINSAESLADTIKAIFSPHQGEKHMVLWHSQLHI